VNWIIKINPPGQSGILIGDEVGELFISEDIAKQEAMKYLLLPGGWVMTVEPVSPLQSLESIVYEIHARAAALTPEVS